MKATLTAEFLDEMAELPKPIGKRCREEIRNLLRSNGTSGLNLERLSNSPLFRIRIGDYRILLQIEGQICLLSGVNNRGSVYSHLDRKTPNDASCEVVRSTAATQTPPGPSGWNLDKIIARLNEQNQRASYGAIAGFLGGGATPRYLMDGRPRNPVNSWVVAAGGQWYGRPTKYADKEIHDECRRQIRERLKDFIQDSEVLAGWLRAKRW